VIDLRRHASTSWVKFWENSDQLTQIRWYFVAPGTPVLPFPHSFKHPDWQEGHYDVSPIQGQVGVMANDPEPRRDNWTPGTMYLGEEPIYEQWNYGSPPPFVGTNKRPCGSPRAWLGARLGRDPQLVYDWRTGVALCCGVPPLPLVIGGPVLTPAGGMIASAYAPSGDYIYPRVPSGAPPGSFIWPTVPLASGDDLLLRAVIASGRQVYPFDDIPTGGYVIGSTTHDPSSGTLIAGGLLGAGDSGLVIGPVAAGADLVWASAGIPSGSLVWAGVPSADGGMRWPASGLLGGALIVARMGIGGFGPSLTYALQQLISTDGLSWGGRVTPPSANGLSWGNHAGVTSGLMWGSLTAGMMVLGGMGVVSDDSGVEHPVSSVTSGALGMSGIIGSGAMLVIGGPRYGMVDPSTPTSLIHPVRHQLIFSAGGSYTWTVPTGVYVVDVYIIGAGGGGGDANPVSGGGGGGGGCSVRLTYAVVPLAVITVVVGTGGVAVANASGTAGGTSSWDVATTATGGFGGGAGGGGGGGGAGDFTGGSGGTGFSGVGGGGGGGGAAGDTGIGSDGTADGGAGPNAGGAGGSSAIGQPGGAGGASDSVGGPGGSAGLAPGGGGGGSGLTSLGLAGAGADGQVVIVWWE
jgi:hypothetical protein